MKKRIERSNCRICSVLLNNNRLKILLLLITNLTLPLIGFSQNPQITLNVNNVKLLNVIQSIEEQSGYRFQYSSGEVDLERKISLQVRNETLPRTLSKIFTSGDVRYSISGKQILLSASPKALAKAQVRKSVKGKVVDEKGGALPGVTVRVKGTTVGISTDKTGHFILPNVPDNGVLIFSFVGMITQEIAVKGKTTIDVQLQPEVKAIDELVVTALGQRRDVKSLGYAISSLKSDEITVAGNTVNPIASLHGKASGVGISIGAAGPTGGVNIRIRGAASLSSTNIRPLFVVDGVPIYDQTTDLSNRGYNPLNSFDYGSGINDINGEDIESIDILKGAKATVLYGSDGANGVVLITTKSGRQTRGFGVNVTYQTTIEQPKSYLEFQNQYGAGANEYDVGYVLLDKNNKVLQSFQTFPNNLTPGVDQRLIRRINSTRYSFGPKFNKEDSYYYDGRIIPYSASKNNFYDLFKLGSSNQYSASISGGGSMGYMRLSYTKTKYNGTMENFGFDKNTLSFSGNANVSKFASFEIRSNLYQIKTTNRQPNIGQLVAFGFPREYQYSDDVMKNMFLTNDGYKKSSGLENYPKAISNVFDLWWNQRHNMNTDDKFHWIASARVRLNFTNWLYFVGQAGIDYTNTDYERKTDVDYVKPQIQGGYFSYAREKNRVDNYKALLNYEDKFLNDQLSIEAFVGSEYRYRNDNNINVATYGNFNYPNWFSLNNESSWPDASEKGKVRGFGRGSDLLYSLYGTAVFSWKNTYYLEVSGRNDWSSTLPPGYNTYFYPGLALHWNFTNTFQIPYMNYGKLRVSWADVGRHADRYFTDQSYGSGKIAGTNSTEVYPPSTLFSGVLKNERKREVELGFNAIFFPKSRLELDFSYYYGNLYNQLMNIPLSSATGASSIKINAGNTASWGYEFFVKGVPVLTDKFRWELTLNSSNQYSKVIKLYEGITENVISNPAGGAKIVAREGDRQGDLYMKDYKRDPNGNKIISASGFYLLDEEKYIKVANVNPRWIGGVTSNFYYKKFLLHFGLDYQFGSSLFSYSNYYMLGNGLDVRTLKYRDTEHGGLSYYVDNDGNRILIPQGSVAPASSSNGRVYHDGVILDGVKEVLDQNGKVAGYKKNNSIISAQEYYSQYINDVGSSYFPDNVYKNDYVKLRELSLEYTLPEKLLKNFKIQKFSVTVFARNLFYLYKSIPNIDSESALSSGGNVEYSFYPTLRTFGLGVNLSF